MLYFFSFVYSIRNESLGLQML